MTSERHPRPTSMSELRRLARDTESKAAFQSAAMVCGLTPKQADKLWHHPGAQLDFEVVKPDFDSDRVVIAEMSTKDAWVSSSQDAAASLEVSR